MKHEEEFRKMKNDHMLDLTKKERDFRVNMDATDNIIRAKEA